MTYDENIKALVEDIKRWMEEVKNYPLLSDTEIESLAESLVYRGVRY